MASIFFNNTANVSSPIRIGIDNPERSGFAGDLSIGEALSSLLNNLPEAYQRVSDSLQSTAGWRVTDAMTTPAGRTSTTTVTFENHEGVSFKLSGNLINNGSQFSLTGNAFIIEYGDNTPVEFLTTTAVRVDFQQNDPAKVYGTRLDLYNGNPSQPFTQVGALPVGAELTNITFGRGQTGIPTQMRQISVENDGGPWMVMQGVFNVNNTDPGSVASVSGSLTRMTTISQPNDGPGLQAKTFGFGLASFDTAGPQGSAGAFGHPSATITIQQLDMSEGFVGLNFLTQMPEPPANTVSTARYAGASVNLSESFFDSESIMFAGNDVFTINSTTDTFVQAGAGNDIVNGGSGTDFIWGGKGDDRLFGNDGNDFFLVNQNEGSGQINTWTFGQIRIGNKTVFTEKLGYDYIDGGDGIDTVTFVQPFNLPPGYWPFSQQNLTAPPTHTTNTGFTGDPNQAFRVGDFGREVLVDLGVSNTEYQTGTVVVNPYKIAAVEVDALDPNNQLAQRQVIVVDLHTGMRLGAVNLGQNEWLAQTSVNASESFYIGRPESPPETARSELILKAYNFGIGTTQASLDASPPEQRYSFDIDLNNGGFNDFINLGDPNNAFAVFSPQGSPPIIYKLPATPGQDAQPIVQIPSNLVGEQNIDFFYNGFVKGSELWLAAYTNFNHAATTGDETFLVLDFASANPEWSTVARGTFWSEWNTSKARDAIARFDNGFLDLRDLPGGYQNEVREFGGSFELPNGYQFVAIYAELPTDNFDIGYERWLVIDTNGTIVADRQFDAADTLAVRGFQKVQEIDGYFYFQTVNGDFIGDLQNGITGIAQPSDAAVSVYRVSSNSIEAFLKDPIALDNNNPHVEKVRDFSQVELVGRNTSTVNANVVILQEYWPVSAIQAGNLTGGAYFVSAEVDFSNETSRLFLGKVEANGSISYRTSLAGTWLEDYAVHPATGQLYLLTSTRLVDGNYAPQAFEFNTYTGTLRSISESQWLEASTNIPESSELSYSGAPGLHLFLPTSYYGNLPTRLTDGETYVTRSGEIGFRTDRTDDSETYFLAQGPADGTIGIWFKNSYSNQDELLHLKDIEYIEMPDADGNLNMYDIRPLYLASRGNDTLYSMSRSNFDSLVTIFNNNPEDPLDLPGAFSDPLIWYRNSLRMIERGGELQWRYYLDGGAGNDVLHGTKNEGKSTEVDRIRFERDFEGDIQITLTHDKYGERTVNLFKSRNDFDWFWFNRDLSSQINSLQIGISAWRGLDDLELIVSGLALTGWTANYNITGTSSANPSAPYVVTQDVRVLETGRDILNGGPGADIMIGYSGNDIYVVDNPRDVVIESPFDEGFDTVFTTVSYALQNDTSVERLQVLQIAPGVGGDLAAIFQTTAPVSDRTPINITGNNFTYELMGHDGNNTITAGSDAGFYRGNYPYSGALMLGMGGNDRLIGSERNDHLFGGTGNDVLIGNGGDDRFYMGFQLANREIAARLLPDSSEYSILYDQGLIDRLGELTGGENIAFGGDGFDTVVVGVDPNTYTPEDGQIYYQRTGENQIRIYTIIDSMLVDSTMEAVEYLSWGPSYSDPNQDDYRYEWRLLPWVSTQTQTDNDLHFAYKSRASDEDFFASYYAYVPASNFSDWVDLDTHPALRSTGMLSSSFDGANGHDVIFGDSKGVFSTLRGGNGNDFLYSGWYDLSYGAPRYEMYGDAGNDTLTLDPSRVRFADGDNDSIAQFLLDGGIGNDHYRVIANNDRAHVRIEDRAGRDTLTLAFDKFNNDESTHHIVWDANELRVYTRSDSTSPWQVFLSAPMGTLQELYLTEDTNFFTESLIGGNLVTPGAAQFATGRILGTNGNDILLPMMGVRLDYHGGAGDDVIILNSVPGGVVSGGPGNDLIFGPADLKPDDYFYYTISYQWAPGGSFSEINLNYGYGYVVASNGTLLGTDRWEGDFITDVLGGAGHDRIFGNERANVLDGGAGNDIIYSGRNWEPYVFDHLIGGFGNDTLIEETHWLNGKSWNAQLRLAHEELRANPEMVWTQAMTDYASLLGFQGSLLEGGAGNDIYVIQHNGAPPSMSPKDSGRSVSDEFFAQSRDYHDWGLVMPTRIVEHDSNTGRDTGGADTIRLVTSNSGLTAIPYQQIGTTVRVEVADGSVAVGDTLMANFLTGRALSNAYSISRVTQVLNENGDLTGRSIAEFEVDNSFNFIGEMHLTPLTLRGLGHWVDNDTMAVFSESEMFAEVLNDVSNGMSAIHKELHNYLVDDGYIKSALPVLAMIDRNAMEFFDIGSNDPEQAGMVLPISFNVGRSNAAEIVIAGGPGNAVLYGGAGTDFIFDTLGDDILIGGDGNDVISSFVGFDIVDAGAGNDLIQFRSDAQILIGGSGADEFMIMGIGNRGGALIADYKPWEGDKLSFDSDWLKKFMNGDGRVFGPSFDEIEFFTDFNGSPLELLNGSSFTVGVRFNVLEPGDSTSTTALQLDLVRIKYHSDLDLVYKQEQEAMLQLAESAQSISQTPNQDWLVIDSTQFV